MLIYINLTKINMIVTIEGYFSINQGLVCAILEIYKKRSISNIGF
jgi:hypothetical protein